MEEKRRARHRLRHVRSCSLISSTCEDTDVSMTIKVFETPIFLEPNRPLGLHVVLRQASDKHDIYVSKIEPSEHAARARFRARAALRALQTRLSRATATSRRAM